MDSKIVLPDLIDLNGKNQYRIISSVYPPINFFEDLVDPAEMETLWEIESLTNERLREEAGDISLVRAEDRVTGPGSSVVMAAFTHLSKSTRFSNGDYGVYYAALSPETAIRENVYHREIFLAATAEEPCELTMRLYEGKIQKLLHDITSEIFHTLYDPNSYIDSQAFGRQLRDIDSWGLFYNSVRQLGGKCIAALRPASVSIPIQTSHLKYIWNGEKITEVLDTRSILKF